MKDYIKLFLKITFLCSLLMVAGFSESRTLTEDESEPIKLPRWRTFEESQRIWMRALPDDYRRDNIDLFRITDPPSSHVRSPGEFEDVTGVILAWLPGWYDTTFLDICRALNGYVLVYILYARERDRERIVDVMLNGGISLEDINDESRFIFIRETLDSVWVRDSGPNFILSDDGRLGVVDARYYYERFLDDKIPSVFADHLGITPYRPSFDMEGGNFMSDGTGRCFTTKGNIWENLPESEYYLEDIYRDYLGCEEIDFVMPLSGEGTTHIDMFAKFLDRENIIIGEYSEDQDCINYDILDYVAETFMDLSNLDGDPYIVTRIPMPSNEDGVWRTYLNSLIVNKKVLVPVYDDDTDFEEEALSIYQDILPDYEIIPVDATDIIIDGGAVHCITMGVFSGNLEPMEEPASFCGDTWDCDPTQGCGSETYEGRCDDNTAIWCDQGVVVWYPCDMDCAWAWPGDPCENVCGYDSVAGYYFCLDEDICNTCVNHCEEGDKGCTADMRSAWKCSDPDGDGCMERVYSYCGGYGCEDGECLCTPQCEGRECGDDGCGGSCGECEDGLECSEEGLCVEPDNGDGGEKEEKGEAGCSGCHVSANGERPSVMISLLLGLLFLVRVVSKEMKRRVS